MNCGLFFLIPPKKIGKLTAKINHVPFNHTNELIGYQNSADISFSLRSKRFRRFFRPFEVFFYFGGAKIGASATLAQSFACSKSEKRFKPAESPTETLATQARYL